MIFHVTWDTRGWAGGFCAAKHLTFGRAIGGSFRAAVVPAPSEKWGVEAGQSLGSSGGPKGQPLSSTTMKLPQNAKMHIKLTATFTNTSNSLILVQYFDDLWPIWGLGITEYTISQPSLEQVFLRFAKEQYEADRAKENGDETPIHNADKEWMLWEAS